MKATPSEITNFFWYCVMAAKLIDELPETTATKSLVVLAVRRATDCIAGKNGVHFASEAASALKERLGKNWDQCELIKEHVVPVSLVRARVVEEFKANTQRLPSTGDPLAGDDVSGLTPAVVDLFRKNPRAWQLARIIREWTVLAWITPSENERFNDRSLHGGITIGKRMPKGWSEAHGKLARYDACGIRLRPMG